MKDSSMDAHIGFILMIILCLTIGSHMCHQQISLKEGSSVTLNCSITSTKDLRSFWWLSRNKRNNKRNKVLTYCDTNSTCSETTGEIQYKKTLASYTETVYKKKESFISKLMILNVSANMRLFIIECVTFMTNKTNSSLFVTSSYSFSVYTTPENEVCQASSDNDNGIVVSCQFSKVFPKIKCHVFPELQNSINSDPGSQSSILLEPVVVQHKKFKIAEYTYYTASCKTVYYPNAVGSYRFRIEIYLTGHLDKLVTSTTNLVTVHSISSKHMPIEMSKMDKSNIEETNNAEKTNMALYTMLGAAMILGTTITVIIGWVVWSRCNTCCSSISDGNEYESIQDGTTVCVQDLQPGLSDQHSDQRLDATTIYSHPTDENTSAHNLIQRNPHNLTVTPPTLPRPHIKAAKRNSTDTEYIAPCTPSQTPLGSSEYICTADVSSGDENVRCSISRTSCVCKEIYHSA